MTTESAPSPSWVRDAALVFVLGGFAIAQPLYDLLGNNPTFFVAHDFDGNDVLLFALAILLIPPTALLALLTASRLLGPTVHQVLRAGIAGLFITLTILPPLERAIGLSTTAWIVLLVLLTAALAIAFQRVRHLRTFLTYLTPAPLLFLVVFLVLSPAHSLVFASDPAAAAIDLQGTRTPVILVVFDEFPLGVLLDEHGAIDATRFPGFARLASLTTWYPNATGVSMHTHLAVPAISSGTIPKGHPVPVASAYPRTVFTLFGRSHKLRVTEPVTELCPSDLCGGRAKTASETNLASDLKTVYLRTLLSSSTATDWGVPSISDRWAGFDQEATTRPERHFTRADGDRFFDQNPYPTDDQVAAFEEFLASLRRGPKPGLWFQHELLPHTPYEWLPDGRRYNGQGRIAGLGFEYAVWGDQPVLPQVGEQRLLLQTMFVDHLVNQLLDRLTVTGLLDEALIAVTADHGAVFLTNEHSRAFPINDRNKQEILPVPMFIKYPGQRAGKVDTRDARTIDILPTIADTLGLDLPRGWHFDGRSLRGARRHAPTYQVLQTPDALTTVDGPVDATILARDLRSFVGAGGQPHDGFRVGPFAALVGQTTQSTGIGAGTGTVRADDWAAYDDVDLDGVLPALFQANVSGVEPGRWIAVALNGSIAGVGPVYRDGDVVRLVAMLDPSFMKDGRNQIEVFAIDSDGRTLHPLARE